MNLEQSFLWDPKIAETRGSRARSGRQARSRLSFRASKLAFLVCENIKQNIPDGRLVTSLLEGPRVGFSVVSQSMSAAGVDAVASPFSCNPKVELTSFFWLLDSYVFKTSLRKSFKSIRLP